jgi:hypothetical protein
MKKKNLIVLALSICLLTTLTNCKKRQLDNKTGKSHELVEKKCDSTNTEMIFTEVEEFPTFPGGVMELLEFIDKKINKKIVSDSKLKEGKVVVTFSIDTVGKLDNFKVIRPYSQTIDSEFIRVLKLMPNWKSGKRLINDTWIKSSFYYSIPLKVPYKQNKDYNTTKPSY